MVPPQFTRPRSLRLHQSAEFTLVRHQGKVATGRYFRMSVAVIPTASSAESRVGLITTRRLGGAVVRVRVRRRLRELHRLHRPQLRPGLWIVLIGRREAATAPWSSLCREWLHLGQKLSIFQTA